MKLMKLLNFLLVIILALLFTGCKEKKLGVTAFSGLGDSPYVEEVKSSLKNKKPVVVGFLASWCPHCRKYKPVFAEVKEEYSDRVTLVHIDIDDESGSQIVERFQVKGIPTTAFIRADGSVYKVQVGGIEKEKLKSLLEELVENKKREKGEPIAPFPIEPTSKVSKKEIKKNEDRKDKEEEKSAPAQELIDLDNEIEDPNLESESQEPKVKY